MLTEPPPTSSNPTSQLSAPAATQPRAVSVNPVLTGSAPSTSNVSNSSTMASNNYRPLNVRDALSYLDQVKLQFQDFPGVYNKFLDIMKDFKTQMIDTPGVIDGVSSLFRSHPALIQGFNTFLPPGYRIDVSQGEGFGQADQSSAYSLITVTHPMGVQTQKRVPIQSGGEEIGSHVLIDLPPALQPTPTAVVEKTLRDTSSAISANTGSPLKNASYNSHDNRAITPVAGTSAKSVGLDAIANNHRINGTVMPANPNLEGPKTSVKPLEFNHAITYVNKIKNRYAGDPKTYQTFLDILQTYQRDARPIQEVYEQVNQLFRGAPDLLVEFMQFLPDNSGSINQASTSTQGVSAAGATCNKRKRHGPPGANASDLNDVQASRGTTLGARQQLALTEALPLQASPTRGTKRKPRAGDRNADTTNASNSTSGGPPHAFVPGGPAIINEALKPAINTNETLSTTQHKTRHNSRQTTSCTAVDYKTTAVPKHLAATEELTFFHHLKTYFEDQATYLEFLKVINLFTQDVIDIDTLVFRSKPFLINCPELFNRFTDIVGWREGNSQINGAINGRLNAKKIRTKPHRTTRPVLSEVPRGSECGPSYRKLPGSGLPSTCSGRDVLCWDVLNDEWVCGPPGTTLDEQVFLPRQTNAFERALYQAEDERHEYDYHIEANVRTIALLEPINLRIQQMDHETRAEYRLKPGLGGQSKSVYQRIIKKIYGKDQGAEVIQALHDNPAIAVPIVLSRLKQKDEEWKKALRDWNRVWREVDGKNYWKALDHQGISFKTIDKKMISNKNLVNEIELIKREQQQKRKLALDPSIIRLLPKYQLQLDLQDSDVFYDVLKVFIHFLDYVPNSTGLDDSLKDRIEATLKSILTMFFEIPLAELERHLTPIPPERKRPDGQSSNVAKNTEADGNETVYSEGDLSDNATAINNASEERAEGGHTSRPSRPITSGRKRVTTRDGNTGPGSGDLRKKAMKNASNCGGPVISERASARRQEANKSRVASPRRSRVPTEEPPSSQPTSEVPKSSTNFNKQSSFQSCAYQMGGEIETSSVRDESPCPQDVLSVDHTPLQNTESSIPKPRLFDKLDQTQVNLTKGDDCTPLARDPPSIHIHPGSPIHSGELSHIESGAISEAKSSRPNFFTNNAYYCLLRLLHMLYTRFSTLKKASTTSHPFVSRFSYTALPSPASAPGESKISSSTQPSQSNSNSTSPNLSSSYDQLLAYVQNFNSGQIDQSNFEDECRNLFGTRGYLMITIDKVCQALVKVLVRLNNDESSREILNLYGTQKRLDQTTPGGLTQSQKLAYRRSVETLTGGLETKLFRMEWVPTIRSIRIQLLGSDDINSEDYDAVEKAWSAYIESYADMSTERTIGLDGANIQNPFLERSLKPIQKMLPNNKLDPKEFIAQSGLGIRVCMRSYRLFFSANTSDFLCRIPKRKTKEIIESEEEESKKVDKVRNEKWTKWITSYHQNLNLSS